MKRTLVALAVVVAFAFTAVAGGPPTATDV
jgi:hypothetical protein